MKKLMIALVSGLGLTAMNAQVVVYTDCNYSGKAQTLQVKSYYNSSQIGLADKTISSIKIPAGYSATVYTEANMKGREVTLPENQKCLPAVLDNAISSIVIKKVSNATGNNNNGSISVYQSCDYRGQVSHFSVQNYSDLKASLKNWAPQSFQVPSGLQVELYSQKNFKGKKLATYTANQSCVGKTIQNAKSMKVINTKPTVKPQPRKK